MVKKIIKISLRSLLALLCFILLYILLALVLPCITVNNTFKNAESGIKITVLSNGMHTDISVPAKTAFKDWTLAFPEDSFDVKDPLHSYICFGWGDKGFFLNTPTWGDLTFLTAFKACTGLSESAMHVSYEKERHKTTERCMSFVIDTASYRQLVTYIEDSFLKQENAVIKIRHPGYGELDRFFESKGTYSLFRTCNNWTNEGLRCCGIKVACWSPSASRLMQSLQP